MAEENITEINPEGELRKEIEPEKINKIARLEKNQQTQQALSHHPGHPKNNPQSTALLVIALIIALLSDTLDFFGAAIPLIGDIVDVVTGLILLPIIKKPAFLGLVEFVPGADIVPFWSLAALYALITTPKKSATRTGRKGLPEWLAKSVTSVFIIIIIGAIIFGFATPLWGGEIGKYILSGDFERTFELASANFANWWKENNPLTLYTKMIEKQVAIATGDYFTGEVDQYAEEELGIWFEDIEPAQDDFYLQQKVVIWANLKGKSLGIKDCKNIAEILDLPETATDIEESIENCRRKQRITLSCGIEDENLAGQINPPHVDAYALEGGQVPVDCSFSQGFAQSGAQSVLFQALFPFKTEAYINSYFMEQGRHTEERRRTDDILTEYGYEEPLSVTTTGPVTLAMVIEGNLPITVPGQARLGITLDNNWPKGKIKEIKRFTLYVPDEIVISSCAPFPLNKTGGIQGATGRRAYVLPKSFLDQAELKDIQKHFTIKCVISPQPEILQEDVPLTIKTFGLEVEYQYELEESANFYVRGGDGKKSDLKDCSSYCFDEDGCTCPLNCTKSEVGYNKNCFGFTPEEVIRIQRTGLLSSSLTSHCRLKVDQCSDYLTQQECDSDPCLKECLSLFEGFNYQGCGSCQDKTCQDYVNKEYCQFDPCLLGCQWNDNELSCYSKEETLFSSWPLRNKKVTYCQKNQLFINTSSSVKVMALASGRLKEYDVTQNRLVLEHPGGQSSSGKYEVVFSNLAKGEIKRTSGNVKSGEVLAQTRTDQAFTFTINGDNPLLFYSLNALQSLTLDPSCYHLLENNTHPCPAQICHCKEWSLRESNKYIRQGQTCG